MRAVRFDRFGPPDVLEVVEREVPDPGVNDVRVRVVAAGLNPVDYKIFGDPGVAAAHALTLPSGNGSDFAGIVDAVGAGVSRFRPGELVYGGERFAAQAEYVVTAETALSAVPTGLPLEVAAVLDIAGRTALAGIRRLAVGPGDILLVSAAAGGVGVIAAQLARRAGAVVVGTASAPHHDLLRELGVVPVVYGPDLADRVRRVAPGSLTAVADFAGRETIEAGLELGVAPARINSVADKPFARAVGAAVDGRAETAPREREEVADIVSRGELVVPIEGLYPLDRVREAYRRLMSRHVAGKLVLEVAPREPAAGDSRLSKRERHPMPRDRA